MSCVYFLCELPPPFGGVTVKNQLIINEIVNQRDDIKIIDFCKIKRNPLNIFSVFIQMMAAYINKSTVIYGFGSHTRLKRAMKLQKIFGGRKSLENTVNIVMGGKFPEYISLDLEFCDLLSNIKLNLVETEGMKNSFFEHGVSNAKVFPNCRTCKGEKKPIFHGRELKCVFFSKICIDKGVDSIISELGNIERITIDFYGHIDDDIKDEFEKFIESHDYAKYHGVFDAANKDVYSELNQYDVLLLPTKWKGEGVPGILVESKMAGIAAVVTDFNYNSEIVKDGVEGVVIKGTNHGELAQVLGELSNDKVRLTNLKAGAFESRKRYSMETYIENLRKDFGIEG